MHHRNLGDGSLSSLREEGWTHGRDSHGRDSSGEDGENILGEQARLPPSAGRKRPEGRWTGQIPWRRGGEGTWKVNPGRWVAPGLEEFSTSRVSPLKQKRKQKCHKEEKKIICERYRYSYFGKHPSRGFSLCGNETLLDTRAYYLFRSVMCLFHATQPVTCRTSGY